MICVQLILDVHGATPFSVTMSPQPIHISQQPLDQHHQEAPKEPPPVQQERQADNQVRVGRHDGDAELASRPLGAIVSQEAASTSEYKAYCCYYYLEHFMCSSSTPPPPPPSLSLLMWIGIGSD
jgi:hypothetical protein